MKQNSMDIKSKKKKIREDLAVTVTATIQNLIVNGVDVGERLKLFSKSSYIGCDFGVSKYSPKSSTSLL